MTSKREADEYSKRREFEDGGYEPRYDNGVRFHGRGETFKHTLVKLAVAYELLQRRGPSAFDTEVPGPAGRVDVLDFGPPDEPPAIYEIETDATPETKRQKVEQYGGQAVPPERVYFLDPAEAPGDLVALREWVAHEVVG